MSFGREIKDFIAGYSAGDKIQTNTAQRDYIKARTKILNDPEMQALQKQYMKARVQYLGSRDPSALNAMRGLRMQILQEKLKLMRNPPKAPGPADDLGGGGLGTPPSAGGKSGALDVDQEADPTATADASDEMPADDTADATDVADSGGAGDMDDDTTQFAARGGKIKRVAGYANGGMVKAYAAGGAVDDDADPDADPEMADAEYRDATPAAAGADDADDADTDTDTDTSTAPNASYDVAAAHEAAQSGVHYARQATGMTSAKAAGAVDDSGTMEMSAQSKAASANKYYRGAGAASPEEMNAVYNAIDPKHQMSDAERNMAALAHVYEWNLKNGNEKGAQSAAGSMMQYFRLMSDRYKALAGAAAERGDTTGALKAMAKSYSNIPDGIDFKLSPNQDGTVNYVFTDQESGKTTEKGVATPEQILSFASKGGIKSFDELVMAAGGTKAALKDAKGPAPLKPRDAASYDKMVTDTLADVTTPDKGKDPMPKDEVAALHNAASHIGLDPQNKSAGILAPEAVGAAVKLADPSQTFQVKKAEGGRMIKFGAGQQLFVPQSQYDELAALRARRAEVLKKSQAEAAKPGIARRAVGAIGGAIDTVKGAIGAGSDASAGAPGRPPEAPVVHPSRFQVPVNQAIPLDDAPPGSVPNRGLGER